MKFIDTYREVKALKPGGFRGTLRGWVLDGLATRDAVFGNGHALDRPRVQFLYVHHVFKDEEAKMHRLMEQLARQHTFIPYGEGVDRVLNNTIDKPYVCISSDDGFKNNLTLAAVLERHGATACFFINPSIIGERSAPAIEEHCRNKLHFPAVEFLDWDDVERLRRAGHEIGSHTWAHDNVAETDRTRFIDDCSRTKEVLVQRCGEARHFAFPYGRFHHFNEMGRQVVFDAGFQSCATAERGCHINGVRPLDPRELVIRRDHIIADWSLGHILYFLTKGSRSADFQRNFHHWEART
jgi:peptidoglycan/xylan/chitin deacetylase (PgdA/CDA1 family)